MALPLAFLGIVYVLISYVGYRILNFFLTQRHNARRARELKCQDPPTLPSTSFLGIDHLKSALAADKKKEFPVEMARRRDIVGAETYLYSTMGSTNVLTSDPKNIQAILATQFKDFAIGHKRRRNFFPLLGNGIFTQDGAGWEHSRTMMRPQFARDQVSDLNLEEQHVQNLMRAIVPNGDGWTKTMDLQVLFFRLTLDSATEFLFGESVDSQLVGLPGHVKDNSRDASQDEDVFATAFDKGQSVLATRARLQGMYWLYSPKDFKKSCTDCHAFIDHFVRLALSKDLPSAAEKAAPADSEKGKKEKYVFLEALAAETRDPIELRSQMLNILLAGRDTTASLIGWVFYSLARDPARYAKLRNIIIEEFGTYSNPRDITFARLKSCQYLQQVNNEALRLYPVVPVNSRTAIKDTTLPRGGGPDGMSPIFVPKGRACDYSVFVMHRRKDIWGEDADEFVPERWEKKKVGWEFLPFNGGPRICIGQQFALTEASYVIVRLMQRFDKMENQDFTDKAQHNLTLTSCSGTGVKVTLHEADE
ncbi:hypothetical protein V495_06553 [Pseudogymnoascus sp. VKM F-4514 (FW-929)]|nr:hypothetical protein V490_07485 [Pseudogymnoascus sp. VKM F-3557]KFY38494.1 hypothetical protein V495_06553 [Pseudogymnoascus sp. VKM F-4514 (FW-929)]KFY51207.1 hypothetical protein V497_09320 [Pseudogymnoascus sp. VKM F-4516 (FW-969)]